MEIDTIIKEMGDQNTKSYTHKSVYENDQIITCIQKVTHD